MLAALASTFVVALPLLFTDPAGAAPSTAKDYAIIARDIVPSGEYGGLPDPATLPQAEPQAKVYDG